MKYLLQIVAAMFLILLGEIGLNDHLSPHFIAEGIIVLVTLFIVELGYDIYNNWTRIYLVVHCWILARQGQFVRFSMSYQYRIKVNDKYLLVKNSNWNHYQHVGGKYKRNKFTEKILSDFEAKDDLKLETTGLMKDDLAVFIPAKNAIKFIDWFNTKKDREVSHWREFYEELIDGKAKLFDTNVFPYVNYNFVGSVITPLKRANGWDSWEILQYDVLDLLPTPAQETALQNLFNQGDTDYIKWADEELIKCLGHDNRQKKPLYKIGQHTKWVLNLEWNKE